MRGLAATVQFALRVPSTEQPMGRRLPQGPPRRLVHTRVFSSLGRHVCQFAICTQYVHVNILEYWGFNFTAPLKVLRMDLEYFALGKQHINMKPKAETNFLTHTKNIKKPKNGGPLRGYGCQSIFTLIEAGCISQGTYDTKVIQNTSCILIYSASARL